MRHESPQPSQPSGSHEEMGEAVVEETLTALRFLPSTCAHGAPAGRVTSDAQPGG